MRRLVILTLTVLLVIAEISLADPTTEKQAKMLVKKWLKTNMKPLGVHIGQNVKNVETFSDQAGQPLYYVVYMKPSGFIIISADDMVEPIVAFAKEGVFDPSPNNPLGALVSRDIPRRVEVARQIQNKTKRKQTLNPSEKKLLRIRSKWDRLSGLADEPNGVPGNLPLVGEGGGYASAGEPTVSDIRVAPLVQSKWSQSTVCGSNCYNYYTPNNYVCGCVATATAQLIRFHQYPAAGIGANEFTITVDGAVRTVSTRGGDGEGGHYNWNLMVLEPASSCGSLNDAQRQAIGALCYDVGVASHMDYTAAASGAYISDAKNALVNTFFYRNAIYGFNNWNDIGNGLTGMVNPNLDAGYPVVLGIRESWVLGHAIIADGYGYDSSTLYHHLNMGWEGLYDAWYNLPDVDAGYSFTSVDACIYNVFPAGSGEIISGRVTDFESNPIGGAAVTAIRSGGGVYSATTNSNGIYALVKVPSQSSYTISVTRSNYSFFTQNVTVGTSFDDSSFSGNRWGSDFKGFVGSGTPDDPIQISNDKQLNGIGMYSFLWNKHFKLVADIDMSYYIGGQFNKIGDDSTPFTGSFDGNGYTISNLAYTSLSGGYAGLFGNVGAGGMIKNLGLVNVDVDSREGSYTGSLAGANSGVITDCYVAGSVSGVDFVGGMVGANEGSISNCNAVATVSGANYVGELAGINSGLITGSQTAGNISGTQYAGGLAGDNFIGAIVRCSSAANVSGSYHIGGLIGMNDKGTITDCYARGGVSGNTNVGGLAGMNHNGGNIKNCYSAGAVTGTSNKGGLVGDDYQSYYTKCFWDVNVATGVNGNGIGNRSDPNVTGKKTAEMKKPGTFVNWDFTNIWMITEPNVYYPMLRGLKFGGGIGTAGDPYLILTPEDMNAIGSNSNNWNGYFKLMANIDLSRYTGTEFKTIGNADKAFGGIFDGNKHKISNFTCISSSINYAGLFGVVGAEGEVKNLDLIDANVNAGSGYYAGGLVAVNYGAIRNCSTTGAVQATGYAGGLVGYNYQGTIENCYSKAAVSGTSTIGGLIGCGNKGSVIDCYSAGLVTGGSYTGGMIGKKYMGVFENSFWDTDTSGQPTSAGGTGKSTDEMKERGTFAGWNFIDTWNINAGVSYPVFKWQTSAIGISPTKCDLVGDDCIDWEDFAVIARHWLTDCPGGACEGADLDDSNRVDMKDIGLFEQYWLASNFTLDRWDFIEQQLTNTMYDLTTNPTYANPDSNYPRSTGTDGKWLPLGIGPEGYVHWAGGFLPGSLWYMYQQTLNPVWKEWAQSWTNRLDYERTRTKDHEAGFVVYRSFGLGYEITGNPDYKQVIIDATSSLLTRYNPAVGCIRSWNSYNFPVIIDGTIALEMVFWASKNGGDPGWYDKAVSQATKTMQNNVRPNGSVWQIVDYNPSTGAIIGKYNKQGYSDNTTWSRGQAWGIYGFTMIYRETLNPVFLQTAQKCADYFVGHLPPDYIPYWDFNAPDNPGALQVRDSSAAAIAASGLLKLSSFVSDPNKAKYKNAAENILNSLSSPAYLAEGTNSMGIILHGTGNGKNAGEVDTSLMYGDYFYIEALKEYENLSP
jgi:hypothetical protein